MLVIRKDQIQHFIAADDAQLAVVVAEAVRKANGERVAEYGDKELAAMVKIGIERARTHELTKAEDIAAYVAVMFEVAPRFDEQPDIRTLLNDASFSPEIRFYQLFERIQEKSWQEAEKRYDDSFWFGG